MARLGRAQPFRVKYGHGPTGNFAITQRAYRFYSDGTESGSVALAAENAAITVSPTVDTDVLLRIGVQESGAGPISGSTNDSYRLEFRQNGGAWIAVVGGPGQAVTGFDSASLTVAEPTTNRLSAGTGSFVANEVSEDGFVFQWQLTADNYSEFLFTLRFVASLIAPADTFDFRLERQPDGGPLSNAEFTYTVTPQASATSGTVFNQSVLANTSPVAALARQTGKPQSTTTSPTAAVVRQTGKNVATTSAPTGTLSRQTGKPLLTSSALVASLTAFRQSPKTLLADTSPVAALLRQTGKPVAAQTAPAATLVRSSAMALRTTTAPLATLTRRTAKSLLTSTAPVATLTAIKVVLKTLATTTAPVAALGRQIGKPLLTSTAPTATLARAIAKSLATVTAPIATLTASKTFVKLLLATANVVAALQRSTGKPLATSTSPAAALSRQTGKALAATAGMVAGLTRQAGVTLRAIAQVAASLGAVRFSPALIDPRYLLTMAARLRGVFPSRTRGLYAPAATRGADADGHTRGLIVKPKDRDEP